MRRSHKRLFSPESGRNVDNSVVTRTVTEESDCVGSIICASKTTSMIKRLNRNDSTTLLDKTTIKGDNTSPLDKTTIKRVHH